jgi:hypothetical protein
MVSEDDRGGGSSDDEAEEEAAGEIEAAASGVGPIGIGRAHFCSFHSGKECAAVKTATHVVRPATIASPMNRQVAGFV